MSASALATALQPEQGEIWECVRSQHKGWRVRITEVRANHVGFEMRDGPARSRGSRHRMKIIAFVNCYNRS